MRVFLSWSGPQSRAVAAELKKFLPKLMNEADPWMSKTDIAAGQRWAGEIAEALEKSSVGIVCVTRANQAAPWLNFEAGAIAKKVGDDTFMIPLAIDLHDTDVKGPLGQFQTKEADEDGVWEVVKAVNCALEKSRPEPDLKELFDLLWPELKTVIESAQKPPKNVPAKRSDRDIIEDILRNVRTIAHATARPGEEAALDAAVESRPHQLKEERAIERIFVQLAEYDVIEVHTPREGPIEVFTKRPVPENEQMRVRISMRRTAGAARSMRFRSDSELEG